jgi:hypothetical protein
LRKNSSIGAKDEKAVFGLGRTGILKSVVLAADGGVETSPDAGGTSVYIFRSNLGRSSLDCGSDGGGSTWSAGLAGLRRLYRSASGGGLGSVCAGWRLQTSRLPGLVGDIGMVGRDGNMAIVCVDASSGDDTGLEAANALNVENVANHRGILHSNGLVIS